MKSCLNLEHKVIKALGRGSSRERWLLAVSGGVDSMVMAEVLFRWRSYLKIELAVAHVHHGLSSDGAQNEYRAQAQKQVKNWAEAHGLPFFTNPAVFRSHHSESELRGVRLKLLKKWFSGGNFDRIAFAHHRDDLLETRLMRLVRGAGPQGVRAMALKRGRVVRPLLPITRAEVEAYATMRKLTWVEDPSNLKTQNFRNWLRQEWLPLLEAKSPGARQSLERSLSHLSAPPFTETIGPYIGLRRAALKGLSPDRQTDVVARYFRMMGMKGYSRRHIEELLKRLGTQQKTVNFSMLGYNFEAGPDYLWASRV